MPASFLTLPRELRDKIYKLCLLIEGPVRPLGGSGYGWDLSPGLLRVNKIIYNEARLFLYQNRFDFTMTLAFCISRFLDKIGRDNADCIRHIYVDFPIFCNLELGNITFKHKNDDGILPTIQNGCANITTLSTSRYITYPIHDLFNSLDDPEIVAEALAVIDTHFRDFFPSLKDIIIEVYENDPSDFMRKQIENYGWIIVTKDPIRDWDSDMSLDE